MNNPIEDLNPRRVPVIDPVKKSPVMAPQTVDRLKTGTRAALTKTNRIINGPPNRKTTRPERMFKVGSNEFQRSLISALCWSAGAKMGALVAVAVLPAAAAVPAAAVIFNTGIAGAVWYGPPGIPVRTAIRKRVRKVKKLFGLDKPKKRKKPKRRRARKAPSAAKKTKVYTCANPECNNKRKGALSGQYCSDPCRYRAAQLRKQADAAKKAERRTKPQAATWRQRWKNYWAYARESYDQTEWTQPAAQNKPAEANKNKRLGVFK